MFKKISQRFITEAKTEHAVKALSLPKRPKSEIFRLWLIDTTTNFCKVTSLHGYVHTINKEFHAFERWFWMFMSGLALITAIVLLWISWNWTAETPTTTVIESTNHPTYNLPFPAVTVCNMNKISRAVVFEVVKDW